MERFEIIRDADGKPAHVNTDDGFIMESRKFDPDRDGWMEDQLNYRDFPAIQTGNDMRMLVDEVNYLRRKLWEADKQNEKWRKAAGF